MNPGSVFVRRLPSGSSWCLRRPLGRGSTSSSFYRRSNLSLSTSSRSSLPFSTSSILSSSISPSSSSCLRYFSSDAAKQLQKTIEKEIEHEGSNFEEDKEIQGFLSKGGWALEESTNDMMVTLTKTKNGRKVTVEFSCIQTGESMGDEGSGTPGGEMSDFTVSIQNSDGSGVSFFCSTTQDEEEKFRYCIGQVRIFDDAKEKENISIYPGPYFEDLDDSFQQSLDEWLAHHDIDAELCDFIDRYAAEKEQKEYLQWLRKFKTFVQ